MTLSARKSAALKNGSVIPAHPLALTEARTLDEDAQRALTRYYLAAGSGGVAVGVHTTQFAIHQPGGLLEPVLAIAAQTMNDYAPPDFLRIAGVCGPLRQAVREAELAAGLGYDAVLLSPTAGDERSLLARAAEVGTVLPVIGFYLQEAVGGRYLGADFWRRLADQPSTVAVKLAPFDRYRTVEAMSGISASARGKDVAVYTGNDDNIVADLLTPGIVGGLLGQWAVWTRVAVELFELTCDDPGTAMAMSTAFTDANGAVFDVRNGFRGCVAGINAILHEQGLLRSPLCLDEEETVSPGQLEHITRVRTAYPWLIDDSFVRENLDEWFR